MDINFELYKVFYYAAKGLSFSEAAHQLYISQSAVSQSIKQLEEKLNTPLFARHGKKIRLTPEGETLFKHIEQAFYCIKSGERSIQSIQNLQQGEVRIGASDTICKYYLLPHLKEFHRRYPHIKIRITNRPSPLCIDLLRKGIIDIGVVNMLPPAFYPQMTVKPLKKIQDIFVAGKAFSHLKSKEISLKDLTSYPLLLLEKNSTTRNFFDALVKKYQIHMIPEIELDSVDLLVELTKIGLGISYVMSDAVEEELQNGELFALSIKEDIPTRNLGLITHSQIPIPVAALKFMELLMAWASASSSHP